MSSTTPSRDRTLMRLAIVLIVLLAGLAVVDLARGTGGRAWLTGVADAEPVAAAEPAADPSSTLFLNVRLFDGQAVHEQTHVLISDGHVAAIGSDIDAPASAAVVDGSGHTLMPGMIDSHVHAFGPVLRSALVLGVTTELDMFTVPQGAAQLKAEQERGEGLGRADLFSAGYLVTSPGGHGTEYGIEIPTLTGPENAAEFVKARVDEGSDYIKIVVDGGSIGRQFTTLDRPTTKAVIEAAHANDRLAVVHVARIVDAAAVAEDGADGIVHVFYDEPADQAIVDLYVDRDVFVVPTLSVLESVSGGEGPRMLAEDTRLLPYLAPADIQNLTTGFPGGGREHILRNGLASVGALHAAGVRILAGTDSPNPGTAHGASMHRELELLVLAGLSPAEALAAATSVPAAAFDLPDRGRIDVGYRADLLLVRGNPLEDITATRDIAGVWKLGARADREGYREELNVEPQAPTLDDSGLISDFESGEITSTFGSGWAASTDSMIGGTSTTDYGVVEGGGNDTTRSLRVTGTIVPGGMAAWAGPMFYSGAQPFAPADLSQWSGFSFWARGDGGTHAIMLFATSLGQMPAVQTFTPTEEWREFTFSFGDFPGFDASGMQALLFSGAGNGEFEFQIDEVRFQ